MIQRDFIDLPKGKVLPIHEGTAPAGPAPRGVMRLLGVPLFYKILIANVGLLLLAAAAGMVLVRRLSPDVSASTAFLWSGLVALAVLALGSLVHAALIRAALSPLVSLERTAHRIDGGDTEARAEDSLLADRDMVRLVRVFNSMLDRLALLRSAERAQSARSLRAQEKERLLTSRELFDEPAQTLAGILLRLRAIIDRSGVAEQEGVGEKLEDIRVEVLGALEHVQDLARRLRPPELDDLGLEAAVDALGRSIEQSSRLRVAVTMRHPLPDLGADVHLAVFRIIQEALRNSAQHSHADNATVTLEVTDHHLGVDINDDGRGFDVATAFADRDGLGLSSMLDRAAHAEGSLSVESRPGHGTRIHLSIPLPGVGKGGAKTRTRVREPRSITG